MDTYTLAVYSSGFGPIAIENKLTKREMFQKLVDYTNKHHQKLSERTYKRCSNALANLAKLLDLKEGDYDRDNAIVSELQNLKKILHEDTSEALTYLKYQDDDPYIVLEFFYKDHKNHKEFVVFAKKEL